MKALKMITTVALSATLLCACGSVDKNTIFTVNNEPITKAQYQKEFDNDYAVTSRFALQEVIVEDYPAEFFHHTIKARCDRGYTIKQAFNEINLDFLAQYLKDYKLNDSDLYPSARRLCTAQR